MSQLRTVDVHPQSQISGFHWWGGGSDLNKRLFYQTASGNIRAIMDDQDYKDVVPSSNVKIGTPLTTIFYNYGGVDPISCPSTL